MKKVRDIGKLILFDTLGALCIILAILTGWLPGPGGIPLLLAGLGLLAINHTWAERWIEKIKDGGAHLAERVFVANPRRQLVYDVVAPLLVTGGLCLIVFYQKPLGVSAGIVLIVAGITLFLGNRDRFKHFKSRFKS